MKLIIDTSAIDRNIKRAEELTSVPVSIMLKSFYDYIYTDEMKSRKVFSMNIEGTVCYSIGGAMRFHSASVVTSIEEFKKCWHLGIRTFYIPVNAYDNREGLDRQFAFNLAKYIRLHCREAIVFGMITSGCINPDAPSIDEINEWWINILSEVLDGISIGGSFYIAELKRYFDREKQNCPHIITDVRIGEYALFGTIPYNYDYSLRGDNALKVRMKVIGIHRERGQIVVKGGYTYIDTKNCTLLSGGLKYINTSSDYTIYEDPFKRYKIGDIVEVVPDYYSLVKLKEVEREYV